MVAIIRTVVVGVVLGGISLVVYWRVSEGDLRRALVEMEAIQQEMEQRIEATFETWANPFTPLRVPLIFNLRRDPYERAQITSNTYYDWMLDRAYLLVPAQVYVGKFLQTFREYPPRQKAASFSLDQVMETLQSPGSH